MRTTKEMLEKVLVNQSRIIAQLDHLDGEHEKLKALVLAVHSEQKSNYQAYIGWMKELAGRPCN